MSTPLACYAVAMQTIGEDVTYPWLMGVSGHAFRFQLSKGFDPTKGGWCGSSPHANCGYNTNKVAMAALPYEVVDLPCDKKDSAAVAKARAAVVASIDAGVPALAVSEELMLIVGYQDGGAVLLRRGAEEAKPKEWKGTTWLFSVLKLRSKAPDRAKLARESLARAVEIASLTESGVAPDHPTGGYAAGLPAIARRAKELRDDAVWARLHEKDLRRVQGFNAWVFYSLVDARATAAEYLKAMAPSFDEPQRAHVARAAELYAQVLKALTEKCPTDVAPQPYMLKPGQTWDNALRHQQADELDQAAAIKKQAIEALRLAVKGQ
jgi:hypothetical protein